MHFSDDSLLPCYVIVQFVSEAYESNLSLNEDHMRHGLQPGGYACGKDIG